MPRIRTIKPEFATDDKMLELSDSCALFYVMLWNHCDDEGKIKNNPSTISKLVARWTREKIQVFIRVLTASGQLELSSCSAWLRVVNWSHQLINRKIQPKVLMSEIQWNTKVDSLLTHTSSSDDSLPDRIGKDRKGKDNPPTPLIENIISPEIIRKEFTAGYTKKTDFMRNLKLSDSQYEKLADDFVAEIKDRDKFYDYRSMRDAWDHFRNWIKKELDKFPQETTAPVKIKFFDK